MKTRVGLGWVLPTSSCRGVTQSQTTSTTPHPNVRPPTYPPSFFIYTMHRIPLFIQSIECFSYRNNTTLQHRLNFCRKTSFFLSIFFLLYPLFRLFQTLFFFLKNFASSPFFFITPHFSTSFFVYRLIYLLFFSE